MVVSAPSNGDINFAMVTKLDKTLQIITERQHGRFICWDIKSSNLKIHQTLQTDIRNSIHSEVEQTNGSEFVTFQIRIIPVSNFAQLTWLYLINFKLLLSKFR